MNRTSVFVSSFLCVFFLLSSANADITVFTDQAAFEAAVSSNSVLMGVETFEDHNVPVGEAASWFVGQILSSGETLVGPDDIMISLEVDNLRITSFHHTVPDLPRDLVVLTTGAFGAPSSILGANSRLHITQFDFIDNPTLGVGFDIYDLQQALGQYQLDILGPDGTSLFSDVVVAGGESGFIGFVADGGDSISSFRVNSLGGGELFDNFQIWDQKATTTAADSLNVFRGIQLSGALADTFESDDNSVNFNPGFVINSEEAPVWLIFDGALATAATSLSLQAESNAGTPGIEATLEAFNWTTSDYDVVDVSDTSFGTDAVVSVDLTAGIADYVGASNEVRARIGWRRTGFTINFPWEVRLDQLVWNQ